MHVSLINDFYEPFQIGGAETVVRSLALALKNRGHEVQVITSRIRGTNSLEMIDGVNVQRIGSFPRISRSVRLASGSVFSDVSPALMNEFNNVLKDFNPDVIHFHNIWLLGPELLTVDGYRKGVTFHDYWPFCLRRSLVRVNNEVCSGPDKLLCRLCQLRSVANLRSMNITQTMKRSNQLQSFLRSCSFFTAPSAFLANMVEEFTNIKTQVVRNLTDLEIEKKKNAESSNAYFLYAGRATHIKGFDLVQKVFSREDLSSYHLKIATTRVHLDRPNIEFLGWQSKESLNKLIYGATAVIVPSLWPENSPMIILEALTRGIPVIASRIGGIPELINHGKTGLLFEVRDETGLANAIKTCANSQGLRESAKYLGPLSIREKFNPAKILAGLEGLYADG